ncbi:MAG: LysR family transcriptional regulator [Polyangiaceae bacterium]
MDRLAALRVFARVVELGSFTRAADALELSRARTSEAIQALEQSLGARLLHRTTRRVSLTDDGRAYYERVRRILDDVTEADASVTSARKTARGKLRVDIPVALGRLFVLPQLPELFRRHPELELELRLENRSIDLAREGVDCAISLGTPHDEQLVARRIATTHLLTCASPAYLARRGEPTTPEQLEHHDCIAFLNLSTARPTAWEFRRRGARVSHAPRGNLAINSMEACVDAAAAGLGVTQVLSSLSYTAIRAGRLRPLLVEVAAPGPSLFAVYPPNLQASARLRVFVDFVAELFSRLDAHHEELVQSARAPRKRRQRKR